MSPLMAGVIRLKFSISCIGLASEVWQVEKCRKMSTWKVKNSPFFQPFLSLNTLMNALRPSKLWYLLRQHRLVDYAA